MDIYIPTRGRMDLQRTLGNLTPKLQRRAVLVINYDEDNDHLYFKHQVKCGVWRLPKNVKGIAGVRQHIMDESDSKYLVMLDDDLRFQFKRRDGGGIFASTPGQTEATFVILEKWLWQGIAHCGIAPRSIYYDRQDEFVDAFRMMHVLAYDRKRVNASGAEFTKDVDATKFTMDDFHMTLQLLERGLVNRVSLRYNSNPSVSNSRGGASEWRTLESHNYSAHRLGKLHKNVKVVPKHNWHGMDGTRYDVIVAWKKAFAGAKP